MPSASHLTDRGQRDFSGSWCGHYFTLALFKHTSGLGFQAAAGWLSPGCLLREGFSSWCQHRANGTTKPKLFLQGTSKLQWETVIAAQTGPAWLSSVVAGCPGVYWGVPAISVPCWCSSCHLWYLSWQLKAGWAVSLGLLSHETAERTAPLRSHRQSAKAASWMFLSVLGNISAAVCRWFLIFKWFNLYNVKLHRNNLSDSDFPASNKLQTCNWFSFSSDEAQCLVTLTHMDVTGVTGSSFFFPLSFTKTN